MPGLFIFGRRLRSMSREIRNISSLGTGILAPFIEVKRSLMIYFDLSGHWRVNAFLMSDVAVGGSLLHLPVGEQYSFLYITTQNPYDLHHLWEEPHSGLAGVMLLPHCIREWYVTRLRRVAKSYKIYTFPSLLQVIRIGRRYGLKTIYPEVLCKYEEPTFIRRAWIQRLVKIIHKLLPVSNFVKIFICATQLGRGYCYLAQKLP